MDAKREKGRPKGHRSLKKLLRAAVQMEKMGISPVEELIKIARKTTDEYLQVQIWTLLQSYVEPLPKPAELPTEDLTLDPTTATLSDDELDAALN